MSETNSNIRNINRFYLDLSFWSLIIANLFVMVVALVENWRLSDLMLVFWGQSVSIGICWFFKLSNLKDFSTKDVKINDMPVEATSATKTEMAVFFLFHFGAFHLIYLFFLLGPLKAAFSLKIISMVVVFFVYQCFSFFYNKKWETAGKPNIGKLMAFPYARIIPMHFTILLGGILDEHFKGKAIIALFLVLKIIADMIMHIFENKGFADKEDTQQIDKKIAKDNSLDS